MSDRSGAAAGAWRRHSSPTPPRHRMSYLTDREAVARALEGLWRSAAPERSVKEDGRVMYRRRVFHILPHHFDLLIDVFAAECAVRLFTLEFTGPWHLGAASSTVSGAFDSEWAHWRWWIAPHAQAFLDNVLRKDPHCRPAMATARAHRSWRRRRHRRCHDRRGLAGRCLVRSALADLRSGVRHRCRQAGHAGVR